MIDRTKIVEIGKFQKTHALRGELNAILDVPVEYVEQGNPLIVDVEGIMVPFYAENIRTKGATSFLVKLQGVDSSDEAREMVNRTVFGPRDAVAEYAGDENGDVFFGDDLAGFKVVDSALGEIGTVARIDDATENVLLVVETPGASEIFIPFVDDFIISIDEEGRLIETDLPEELVNLNKKNDE